MDVLDSLDLIFCCRLSIITQSYVYSEWNSTDNIVVEHSLHVWEVMGSIPGPIKPKTLNWAVKPCQMLNI